jgi:hypothetical protein
MAHYSLGFVQAQTGNPQAAVEATDVARQLSPFDPMMYAMCAARAWALFRLEQHEEAADRALKAAQKPNAHMPRPCACHSHTRLRRTLGGIVRRGWHGSETAAGLQHRGFSVVVPRVE